MLEFVEHFELEDGKFLTDIWYNSKTCQYSSVISDMEPVTFSSLREIKLYITGTLKMWREENHDN